MSIFNKRIFLGGKSGIPANAIKTPSGRIIYPQDNGIVMEGTYEGNPRKLLIVFARDRKRNDKLWGGTNALIDDLYQHSVISADDNKYIYRQKDNNGVPQHVYGDTNTLEVNLESVIGPLTDTQLDIWTKPMYQNENKTAHECTDLILTESGTSLTPAASYCRSLTSLHTGGFDLPLLRDLLAMYVEGDYIDSLDPTVADYPSFALGKYSSNYSRWLRGSFVWSCQQYINNYTLGLNYKGNAFGTTKTNNYSVVPVREL